MTAIFDQATASTLEAQVIAELRGKVGDRLAGWAGDAAYSAREREEKGRELINAALAERTSEAINTNTQVLSSAAEQRVAKAVFDALFGLGGFQELLDRPDVENIYANGCDVVFIDTTGEKGKKVGPVAASDEELVEMIRMVAARAGTEERRFDRGSPHLNLALKDGSRLFAVMGISERPSVSIRRHRYSNVPLGKLVEFGTLPTELADQLAAAVRARLNIVIAGGTNAGKTTLLNALAGEIPPSERLVTIEDTFELGLHKDPVAHPNVVPLQAREANLEGVGEISQAACVRMGLRMSPDRVIVGEVRGDEILPMLNAMSQGNDGSMTTVHANSTAGVFQRFQAYAAQAPEKLGLEAINLLVAGAVDVIVHVAKGKDGKRFVTGVREVTGCNGAQVTSNEVYRPGPDGRAEYAYGWRAETVEKLIDAGADPASFQRGWTA
ncbi:CpaF family protein [Actinospica sp. MGRD01-02]|uniref:CpaF family protein n=1 Tax=Actinospica acidithermotolerans TaxID=2828514 RepID=A0A941ECG4_9ACTN|nr:ATPase, T2SS/T4P/T4SS family [Actinospica acidithermotolerans]MBR7827830.1 CpaF family protein [Actinospica acidithermotolerans]